MLDLALQRTTDEERLTSTDLEDENHIRLARVYGLGPEFESQLQGLKREATTEVTASGTGNGTAESAADGNGRMSKEQAEWQREVEKDRLKLAT